MILNKSLFIITLIFFVIIHCNLKSYAQKDKWDKTSPEIFRMLDSAYNLSASDSPQSIELANKSYDLSIQSRNPHNIISSLIIISSLNQGIGNPVTSLEKLNLARHIADSINSDYWRGMVDLKLGEINRATTNFELSLKYLHSGKWLLSKINYNEGVIKAENRLAAVYFELYVIAINNSHNVSEKEHLKDSLLYYANKSLKESINSNTPDITLSNYQILASYYLLIKDYQHAKDYLEKSEALAQKYSSIDLPLIYTNLSNLYTQLKLNKQALYYALEANKMAIKSGIKVYRKLSAEQLVETYRALGDYKSALIYADSVKKLILELYNNKIYTQMYLIDTQKKIEQQNLIVQKEKEKNRLQTLIFSFVVIVLVILFAIVFINRRRTLRFNNQLMRLNKEISKQKDELDNVIKSKDKFFSIIAHDLRNPFGSFLMLTKYIKEELQNLSLNELQEYMDILSSSSDNLYKLLENLLEWSKIQRGKIEPQFSTFNVSQVVKMSVSLVEQQANAKSQKLINNVNPNISGYADFNIINTVLRNLLTNAIKFTPRGGKITIDSEEKDGKIIVSVSDTGIGMDDNTINKLFKIEEKIGMHGTDGEPSTGLGLVLCKEFMELNNGKIYLESKLGEGSTFFIEFPKSDNS